MAQNEKETLLKAEHVKVYFKGKNKKEGVVRAVDDVSLDIHKGETFGVVGESQGAPCRRRIPVFGNGEICSFRRFGRFAFGNEGVCPVYQQFFGRFFGGGLGMNVLYFYIFYLRFCCGFSAAIGFFGGFAASFALGCRILPCIVAVLRFLP